MSKAAHTPGPWALVNNQEEWGYGPREVSNTLVQSRPDDDGYHVAAILTDIPVSEALANARLIAAAPDMLSALAPFAKYFATYAKTANHRNSLRPLTGPLFGLNIGADDEAEITVEDFKAASAAIDKALGTAPVAHGTETSKPEAVMP